jgi:hypothetical protein
MLFHAIFFIKMTAYFDLVPDVEDEGGAIVFFAFLFFLSLSLGLLSPILKPPVI